MPIVVYKIILCTLFCIVSAEIESFKDFKVLRLKATNEKQLEYLERIIKDRNVDVWTFTTIVGRPVDIMANRSDAVTIENFARAHQIDCETVASDVDGFILKQVKVQVRSKNRNFFSKYQSVRRINRLMENMEKKYPSVAKVEIIGESYEKRSLKVIHIGDVNNTTKKRIWIDAGIHAREWLTIATASYLIKELTTKSETQVVQEVLSKFSFTILPVFNPDGYEYSRKRDRLWRKTRSWRLNVRFCHGVDANRNWDFQWSSNETRSHCSNTYSGKHPFSEPEVKAVSSYILKHEGRWGGYLSLHSYGQFILYPWANNKSLPEEYVELERVAKIGATALRQHGSNYVVGSVGQIFGPTFGSSIDWALGVAKIPYSYGFELRDIGRYGFLFPPEEIIKSGNEIFEAIVKMVLSMK